MSTSASGRLAEILQHIDVEDLKTASCLNVDSVLTKYDLAKINKLVADTSSYLSDVSVILGDMLEKEQDLQYWYDLRRYPGQLMSSLQKVDLFLRSVSLRIESLEAPETDSYLRNSSLQTVDLMQLALNLKKRCDASGRFKELHSTVLGNLKQELSLLSSKMSAIRESQLFIPLPSDITVDNILEQISSEGVSSLSAYSLPIFSSFEKETLDQLSSLEARFEPIRFSIEMLDQTIVDFKVSSQSFFPKESDILNSEFKQLRQEWCNLHSRFSHLKRTTVDFRLGEILRFLIKQTIMTVNKMIESAKHDPSTFQNGILGSDLKKCSRIVNLVHKVFMNNPANHEALLSKFNDELLPSWAHLHTLLETQSKNAKEVFESSSVQPRSEKALKTLNLARAVAPSAESSHRRARSDSKYESKARGIDLCLSVDQSPAVPVSIKKFDRIIDLSPHTDFSPRDIQSTIMQINEFTGENIPIHRKSSTIDCIIYADRSGISESVCQEKKLETISPETTTSTISSAGHAKPTQQSDQTSMLSENRSEVPAPILRNMPMKMFPSKIPRLVPFYRDLHLPVLKKLSHSGEEPSRIPTISPDNPVFRSPEQRAQFSTPVRRIIASPTSFSLPPLEEDKTTEVERLMSPPEFLLHHVPKARSNRASPTTPVLGEVTNTISRSTMSRSTKLKANAKNLSLSCISTPDLTYLGERNFDSISPSSWRSTSPDRPGSSMGSRFDDKHLTPPLVLPKRQWR